jgi:guanylate kinase
LFVVSAPSGTGKTTVVERLVGRLPDIELSRSYTSRQARAGEQDGVDYHFVTRDRFEAMIAAGEFLEWADVFGNLYGTCGPETERLLSAGRDVVLVIDVQGAQQVRECGLAFVSIFVLPPSFTALEQRLRGRSKDSDAAIRRRLDVASDAFEPLPQRFGYRAGHAFTRFLSQRVSELMCFRVFDVQGHGILHGRMFSTFLYCRVICTFLQRPRPPKRKAS